MNADVRTAITVGNSQRALDLIRDLSPADRKAVGKELPQLLREVRDVSEHQLIDGHVADALMVAGLATIGGAAAAANWMGRADLLWWTMAWDTRNNPHRTPSLLDAVADRPDEWVADVVDRAAGRLKTRWQHEALWRAIAALVPRVGGTPPDGDTFVLGWTQWAAHPQKLADDPFTDTLFPRVFEVDGAGHDGWAKPVAELTGSGRFDRADVLDRCVRRMLRGGRVQDLRWFVALHDELAPTPEESALRLRDLVRMLPAAPGPIADLALREIRRVDAESPIPLATFAEAVDAAAFRPEKRLVRSALAWAGQTARKHGRQDAAVLAVLPLFASENLDLRERAVKLAGKHADDASAETRQAALTAGADLPADLRALLPGAVRPVDDAVPENPGRPVDALPPYTPPAAPTPIGSAAGLAEALTLWQRPGWPGIERIITGFVEQAHKDPDGTREALTQVTGTHPWLVEPSRHAFPHMRPWQLIGNAIQSVTDVRQDQEVTGVLALAKAMSSRLRQMSRTSPAHWEDDNERLPLPFRFLVHRMLEAIDGLGRRPFLLAAPTEANGLIDPAVLVDRALRYEADGVDIGPADLVQALLRTPRDIGSDVLKRAAGLTSEQGRTLADFLGADVPPTPEIGLAPVTLTARHRLASIRTPRQAETTRLLPASSPSGLNPALDGVRPLFTLPWGGRWDDLPTLGYWLGIEEVPRMLPSHRELAAAHLLPAVSGSPEADDSSWGRSEIGDAVLALAEADGPAGPATGAVLAYATSDKRAAGRAVALEALFVLASRNLLPAADMGRAIATLVELDGVKLTRITGVLGEAVHAGAFAEVWEIAHAALPPLLTSAATERTAKAPRGLGDLLQLAARCAETVGARADLPGLADVAARGGTSHLVREARRLEQTLTAGR